MDDGVDLPSQFLFPHPEMPGTFGDLLGDAAAATCTHTHTCNPPGPSAATHTHTCLHTHTHQLFAAGSEDDDAARPRRPLGNREAVRKYREKKKAHAAFLEEEVKKLRAANQQLQRRLQGHATLEAEVARLRGLLFDVRAKIDAEAAGAFPFQKQCSVGSGGACWEGSSGPASVDCRFDEDGSGNGGASREIDAPEQPVRPMDVVELCFPS
uniref:BZIP domain-containing protein n=1 Tax=Aegilops tauschii subsp. strangulata TaxID=200361 RepID=A0A452ZF15_AEGTS